MPDKEIWITFWPFFVWGKGKIVNLAGGRTIAPTCDEKYLKCALESFWNSTQKTSVSPWSKKKVLYFGKNARRPYKVLGPNNMVKVRSVRLFKKKSSHPEGFSIWQVPWPRTWRKKTSLEAPGTHSSRRVLVLWVLGPYNMAKVRSVSLFKKNPSHPEGFSIWQVPWLRAKNLEEENPPRSTRYTFFEAGPRPLGSWLRNLPNRKSSRLGRFFRSS